jgi:hypothetical protein
MWRREGFVRKILECTWYEVYNPLVTGEDKFAILSDIKGEKSLYYGFVSSCKKVPSQSWERSVVFSPATSPHNDRHRDRMYLFHIYALQMYFLSVHFMIQLV